MIDLRSQRVLVTGGTGFLGRVLVRQLRERDVKVVALGHKDGNLTRDDVAQVLLKRERPDIVVHLAVLCGGIGANRARPADFLAENAMMGLNVLRACVDWQVRKVVMLGSICAYPKHTPVPFCEDAIWNGYPEETNAPYGTAKRLLLVAAQAYRQQYGLNAINLFPTNMYGANDHFDDASNHVIPALIGKFCGAARRGESTVELWGDGSPTRGFLYVTDAAEAIIRALEVYDSPEPLNLGSGEEVTIRDLATKIAELSGYRSRIEWNTSYPNGQPRRLVDSSRARAALGWEAKVKLAEGLKYAVESYLRGNEPR